MHAVYLKNRSPSSRLNDIFPLHFRTGKPIILSSPPTAQGLERRSTRIKTQATILPATYDDTRRIQRGA